MDGMDGIGMQSHLCEMQSLIREIRSRGLSGISPVEDIELELPRNVKRLSFGTGRTLIDRLA